MFVTINQISNNLALCNCLNYLDTGEQWEYNGTICHIFMGFKEYYDSVRREILYNTGIEFYPWTIFPE
jgi:hypothetical protein